MSAHELSSSNAVADPQPVKLFTVDEANRALPLVRRIVKDIVAQYHACCSLGQKHRGMSTLQDQEALTEIEEQLSLGADRLQELIDELREIGCELKDPETGLIDFRAAHEDREVYLCWKLGEDAVTHWHDLQAGAIGRQTVDENFGA